MTYGRKHTTIHFHSIIQCVFVVVVWHWVINEQFYIWSNWLCQLSCISKHRTPGHGHSPACDSSGLEAHPLYAPHRTPPCIAAAFVPTWPPSAECRLSPLLWRSRPHTATFPSISHTPSLYGGALHNILFTALLARSFPAFARNHCTMSAVVKPLSIL